MNFGDVLSKTSSEPLESDSNLEQVLRECAFLRKGLISLNKLVQEAHIKLDVMDSKIGNLTKQIESVTVSIQDKKKEDNHSRDRKVCFDNAYLPQIVFS